MFPSDTETTPKIRFKGVNGAWEQRKIGDLGVTYAGLSGKKKEDFGHGEAEFIPYLNVFTHPIADVTMTEAIEIDDRQVKVQNGDVLFTTSSETPEEVGMSSVWLKNSSNTYLNSFCFGFRLNESINSYYLAYMLRSKDVRNKIVLLAQGISRYNISKKKMMEINVPIPTDAEQRKVGEIFKQLDNLINLYRQQIEKLKNIKSALLEKQALTMLIIFKILMFIRSDVILTEIGKYADLKWYSRRSVKHKPLRRNFHNNTVAASLYHLCKILLYRIGFRRRIICRNTLIPDQHLYRPDQPYLMSHTFKDRLYHISSCCLALRSGYSDHLKPICRISEIRR
jgi:hypothetical protein